MPVSLITLLEADGDTACLPMEESEVMEYVRLHHLGQEFGVVDGVEVDSISDLTEDTVTVAHLAESDGEPVCFEMSRSVVAEYLDQQQMDEVDVILMDGLILHPYGVRMSPWLERQRQAQAKTRKGR